MRPDHAAARRLGLTILSRLATFLGLVATGCATTVPLDKVSAPMLVRDYNSGRPVVLRYEKERYLLGPEHEPELVVETPPCFPRYDAPGECESLSSPLRSMRSSGTDLYFAGGRRLVLRELGEAQLVVHGEPLAPLVHNHPVKLIDRRFRVGVQLGGTSFFQVIARWRAISSLFLDFGLLMFPLQASLLGNGSAGLLYEVPFARRFSVYGGAGAGFGFILPRSRAFYGYGRLGLAARFGVELRDQIGIDGGAWLGSFVDGTREPGTTQRMLWPMAGISYLHSR